MTLFKKALRDIWNNRRAYLACVVLIALGVSTFISFHVLHENLGGSLEGFYETGNFAHVFAKLQGVPVDDLKQLERVEGIGGYTARLGYEARVMRAEGEEIATLMVTSQDPDEESPVNDFVLTDGVRRGEGIVVGEDFLLENGLWVGDEIELLFLGRSQVFPIIGAASSPEYVYNIRNVSDTLPDNYNYGFAYLSYGELSALLRQSRWVNEIGITLDEGFAFEDVRYELEDIFRPYGLRALYSREDQPSHTMISMEIDSIGSMASSIPLMFIGISVILLYIMMGRIIEQERTQIGVLLACGHGKGQVLGHYLTYGAFVGLAGGIVGDILGYLMTGGLTNLMLLYFKLPEMHAGIHWNYMFLGLGLSIGSGGAGAFFGAWGVLRLTPSQAMRPPAPREVRRDILSSLSGLRKFLSTTGKMALRSIDRARFRSAFVVLGVMLSFGVLAFMGSYMTMIDDLLFAQFTKIQVYEMKIALQNPVDYLEALEELWSMPGVSRAEGMLEISAELSCRHRSTSTLLIGIEEGGDLYQVYDDNLGRRVPLKSGGVILSHAMAEKLEASAGDLVTIQSPYFEKEVTLPVLAVVQQNMGASCYLSTETLWDLLEVGPTINSLIFDTTQPEYVREQLLDARNIASISDQKGTLEKQRDMMGSVTYLIFMMQGVGIVIAFAIIYNTSAIALSERKREYATLRVLGMHPGEIGSIIRAEYLILSAVGMAMGVPLTRLLKKAIGGLIDMELFTIPLDTPLYAFGMAVAGCMFAVFWANRSTIKQVTRFDMMEVLKERE